MSRVYLFDGTLSGFQSVLPVLWNISKTGDRLQSIDSYIPGIFEEAVPLDPSVDHYQPALSDEAYNEAVKRLLYAFSDSRTNAFEQTPSFLFYVRNNGLSALTHFAEPCVNIVTKAARRTAGEAHKLKGLLRFRKIGSIFYGPYFSRSFVLPMLSEHFRKRLPGQQWILHDTERSTGIFYNGHVPVQAFFDETQILELTALYEKNGLEDPFEALWKSYFDNIAIEYRKNPKLQQSFMPKQYWKYIPEVSGRLKK